MMKTGSRTLFRHASRSDVTEQNINERVIALYRRHSVLYQRDEADRRRYFKRQPTFFACLKCMDGRVEFPTMTKTARGLVKQYRAVGGRFELFWPAFQPSLSLWVKQAITHDAHSAVFVTSHFCSREHELGCMGWDNDVDAARAHMRRLAQQMEEDYGSQLAAIPSSVDTSYDNLILHGPHGDVSGESLRDLDVGSIRKEIRNVFPDMHEQVIKDLTPLMVGNAARVAELRRNPRSLDELSHDERVIAIGEGFDGLSAENFALMNCDANLNLESAVVLAAKMIQARGLKEPPHEQATIFTNIFFGDQRGVLSSLPAMDKRCAVRRSRGLQEFAQTHIKKHCPDLWRSGRLHFLTGVTREPTRELEVVDQGCIGDGTD